MGRRVVFKCPQIVYCPQSTSTNVPKCPFMRLNSYYFLSPNVPKYSLYFYIDFSIFYFPSVLLFAVSSWWHKRLVLSPKIIFCFKLVAQTVFASASFRLRLTG